MEKRAAQPSSSAQLTREKHVQDIKWTNTKFWRESLKTEKNIKWTRTDGTEIYKTWNICQKYNTNKSRHKKSCTARIQHWLCCVTQDMIGQKKSCTARIQHWLFFVTQTHKKSSNEDTFSKIKKWRNSFWRWKWKRT